MNYVRLAYTVMTALIIIMFTGLSIAGLMAGQGMFWLFPIAVVVLVSIDYIKEVRISQSVRNLRPIRPPPCPHPKVEEEVKLFTFQEFEI